MADPGFGLEVGSGSIGLDPLLLRAEAGFSFSSPPIAPNLGFPKSIAGREICRRCGTTHDAFRRAEIVGVCQ